MSYFNNDIKGCKVIQVIEVITCVGGGSGDSPFREITAYFDLDGELLAEYDKFLHKVLK